MDAPRSGNQAAQKAQNTAQRADDTAQKAADSEGFERVARAGFVANGLVHAIIGGTAISLALGKSSGNADQGGAIAQLASKPFGLVLLWICFLGCALLAVWNLMNAGFGSASLRGKYRDFSSNGGRTTWRLFASAIGQGLAYAAVAVSFAQFIGGRGKSSAQSSSSFSGRLAQAPGGIALLLLVGVALAVVGVAFVVIGVRQSWKKKLEQPSSPAAQTALTWLGIIGYCGKGVTIFAVGVLCAVAALHHNPGQSTGVDGALHGLKQQPFGVVLLLVVGLALVVYGVFLAWRAKLDKMDQRQG